jgi:hypothetical protein
MMKKSVIFTMGIFLILGTIGHASDVQKEKEAIKEIIQYSLIDGYLNKYDVPMIEKGIHPEFVILEKHNGKLRKRTYSDLMAYVKKVKPQRPDGRRVKVTIKILSVDVVGEIGCAKVEFYVGTTLHGTDYITLMKFDNQWKIMASIAHENE